MVLSAYFTLPVNKFLLDGCSLYGHGAFVGFNSKALPISDDPNKYQTKVYQCKTDLTVSTA
jgi:hypothetical protein